MRRHVRYFAAGTAQWGRQLETEPGQRIIGYEADLLGKFAFDDGDPAYVRCIFTGMDTIVVATGEVPTGYGYIELTDLSGDGVLHGKVEWLRRDGLDAGIMTITHGSGKRWAGVTGKLDLLIPAFCVFDDPFATYNDPKAMLTMGLVEGEGELQLQG